MKHTASVALVVGLAALLGCRGEVLLGSEPQPDGSAPSSSGMMMSSGGSSSGPQLGSEPQPDGSTPSSSGTPGGSTPSSSGTPGGSTPSSSGVPVGGAPSDSGMIMSSGDSSIGPTWTQIYTAYLATGTVGNCSTSSCHQFQMNTAENAYSYLGAYITGSSSVLAKTGSCLSWYGGNMPPGGPRSVPMAVADMNAWAAAGAMNN